MDEITATGGFTYYDGDENSVVAIGGFTYIDDTSTTSTFTYVSGVVFFTYLIE